MALMMLAGFILVRVGLVKSEGADPLARVLVYVVCPCAFISAFQVELTPEVVQGFLLALGAGLAMQLFQMAVVRLLKKPLKLSGVEMMASDYSNCGNLVIPLVGFSLGDEWVIYTLAYMSIQTVFCWTHGKALIEGTNHFEPMKLLLNINLIAVVVGGIMFAFNIRLTGVLDVFVTDMGQLIGPLAMLITGMIVGGMKLPEIVKNPRVWLITGIRLLLLPAMTCAILKFSGLATLAPNGTEILLVLLLGVVGPTANNSVQLSQVYGTEAPYASAINVVSTVLCIVTMPIFTYLYLL